MKPFHAVLAAVVGLSVLAEPLPYWGAAKAPVWTSGFGYRWISNRDGRQDPVRSIGGVEVILAADWDLEDRGIRTGGLAGWRRLEVIYQNETADRTGFVASVPGDPAPIAIQNYPGTPTSGELVYVYAKRVGTKRLKGVAGQSVSVVLWDYGTPVEKSQEQPTESPVDKEKVKADRERKAAEARFAGVKTRAEGGSTNAMLELAKMYRTGTGTETNDFEARVWEIRAGK